MQITRNSYKFEPGSRVRRCFTVFALLLPVALSGACSQSSSENTINMSPTANNNGAYSSRAMLTDKGIYASTTDKTSLVGKTVKFTDTKVVRVAGPRTFTVASGKDEIFVMLADESARGVGTQGKINVGDTVSVKGDFESLNAAEINDINNNRFRPLTETERAFLKSTEVFLQANQVSGGK